MRMLNIYGLAKQVDNVSYLSTKINVVGAHKKVEENGYDFSGGSLKVETRMAKLVCHSSRQEGVSG